MDIVGAAACAAVLYRRELMSTEKTGKKPTPQNSSKPSKPIKTIKSIYVEKSNDMAYFIGSFKADDEEFVEVANIKKNIPKSAFAHSDIEKVLFKSCTPNISEKAFEGCEKLHTVIFGELGKDKTDNGSVLNNLNPNSITGDYTIQANAFKDCSKLTTVVLPEIAGTLTIERDAFAGCKALRTVLALCDKSNFTENPFADCPEHLTFVCKEDSAVARFARENGYRSVYV